MALCARAVDAVQSGYNILIVSDRLVDGERVAIPALLATSAVHQHLIRAGLRTNAGLVVETGSAREVHHFALLGGYGAEAIHPYLALESLGKMSDPEKAVKNFVKAIGKGLNKVMSKMGISTYMSYTGAQIFEAVGLQKALVDKYFTGTASNIEGIGIFQVAEEALRQHRAAFGNDPVLANDLEAGGEYACACANMWTPDSIAKLQHASRQNNYRTYKEYAQIINDQSRRHMTLRGLFEFRFDPSRAIPLDDVEPAKEIVKRRHRRHVAGLDLDRSPLGAGRGHEPHRRQVQHRRRRRGRAALSRRDARRQEHHQGRRHTGLGAGRRPHRSRRAAQEGRLAALEDQAGGLGPLRRDGRVPVLGRPDPDQDGPGRQARRRRPAARPQGLGIHRQAALLGAGRGPDLAPPHHDIYSIEDLAQLIHDLKNVNAKASISVKLVSEVGVGTVAAGVAKAKADHVVIAGHDGGTGASPVSSIKHVGTPWELGLAETQQTLVLNRLRSRIRVQADGQMKTGRDVVIGALLGADEFGFATAPLVVEGCIMMRKCHLNTCPVGVATQDPVLRQKFQGKPEHVVNFFFFIAEEVREIMAQLGIRKFDDLIGRADLLDMRSGVEHWKASGLDFTRVFHQTQSDADVRQTEEQDHGPARWTTS